MNGLRLLLPFIFLIEIPFAFAQTDTLRLLFAGDVMGHGPMISAARQADGTYNYDPFFVSVKPLIEQADFAIANLELTLPGKPPYTGYPMFRSPDVLADALKNAGFDMLVTSNNHSNDGGLIGVTHTIDVLRELGFYQTGTFKTLEERDIFYPLIVYVKGFKLVFLNYTYDTNGVPDHKPSIVNRMDTAQVRRDFMIAKSLAPDFIIPIMHWGIEYQLKPNGDQRFWAKKLMEWGADLIVGMHPHVVQPIENQEVEMPEGESKQVVTVWSLGNFISNQIQPNTDGGIVFQAILIKEKGAEKARLTDYGYSPVWRYVEKKGGKTTFIAVPVSENFTKPEMAAPQKAAMEKFQNSIKKQLSNVREW